MLDLCAALSGSPGCKSLVGLKSFILGALQLVPSKACAIVSESDVVHAATQAGGSITDGAQLWHRTRAVPALNSAEYLNFSRVCTLLYSSSSSNA